MTISSQRRRGEEMRDRCVVDEHSGTTATATSDPSRPKIPINEKLRSTNFNSIFQSLGPLLPQRCINVYNNDVGVDIRTPLNQ
ncbi:hypothetical protein EV1_022109 [Malus domestica]